MKKICIITGGSSGMGVCFAQQLLHFREFDEMWLIARRIEKLQEVSDKSRPQEVLTILIPLPCAPWRRRGRRAQRLR